MAATFCLTSAIVVVMSPLVHELRVYKKAVEAADAIFQLTERSIFGRDPELRTQMRKSSGRIQANLEEGDGQTTDKHYGQYVARARGSAKEMKGHLRRAVGYKYITQAEYKEFWETYDAIAGMLSRLKKHLDEENRKERG